MSAVVEIGFNANAVHAGLAKVETRLSSFAAKGDKLMAGAMKSLPLIGSINLPSLARFGGDLVSAAAKMEGYRAALKAISQDAAPVEAQLARLRELAKSPGLSFDEAVKGSIRLQATGLSAVESERVLKEMANALRSVGAGAAELDGVTLALAQIQAKGKVSAEEINQIAERMPQIRAVMQDAFGTASSEELQKMGLSSRDFILGITAELERTPRVANGANSAIEQLVDNFEQLKAAAGEPLAQAVVPIIKDMTAAFIENKESLAETSRAVVQFAPYLIALGKAAGTAYLAAKMMQWGQWIQGLRQQQAAVARSTATTTTGTAAVNANTAAQRANAAAVAAAAAAHTRRAAVPPLPAPVRTAPGAAPSFAPPVFNAGANMAAMQAAAQRAAAAHAASYMGRLGAGLTSGGNMLGTVAANMYASSLLPASVSAAEQASHAMLQTLTAGMSMMGGKLGVAGLGGSIVQALMLNRAKGNLNAAKDIEEDVGRSHSVSAQAEALLQEGNLLQARKVLETEIALLASQRASAEGDAAMQIGVSQHLLQRQLDRSTERFAKLQQAAREPVTMAKANREIGDDKESQAKLAEIAAIKERIRRQDIDALPVQERIAALMELQAEKLKAMQLNGGQLYSATIDGMKKLASTQLARGQLEQAQKTFQKLEEVLALQKELDGLQGGLRDEGAAAAEDDAEKKKAEAADAERVAFAREEADLEMQILHAKVAAAGQDSAAVRALEDKLAIMRMARQIEDAGVAAGAAAVEQAQRHVGVQRQISDIMRQQQQAQGKRGLMEEMAILQAKANGQDELAKRLERERDIRERTRQIMEQTGANEGQARTAAERMQELQEKANERDGEYTDSGRRRIKGYSRELQGGAEEGRERAQAKLRKFWPGMYAGQNPGAPEENPLASKAAANATKADAPAANNANSTQQVAQVVLQVLPQILEALK